MTEKQLMFIKEYLVDLNATKAAARAGYSAKTAGSQGERLLKDVEIRAAIDKEMAKRSEKVGLTAEKVLADIEAIMLDAMKPAADKDGNVTMNNHAAALKACELRGKHLKMFTDKVEHGGNIAVTVVSEFDGADD